MNGTARIGVTGLSSTYLTGILTTVVVGFVGGKPFREQPPVLVNLLALIAGAAADGALVLTVPCLAPVLLVVPLLAVIVSATFLYRR